MPILTESDQPRKRRASVWLCFLAVVVLLLGGAFVWSWFYPVRLAYGTRWVVFGRTTYNRLSDGWESGPGNVLCSFKIPGGQNAGWYGVEWQWL